MSEILRTKPVRTLGAFLAVVLLVGACSSSEGNRNNPTEPEELPPVDLITQNFSGQLPQKGRECEEFDVIAGGTVTLEITELEPLPSLTVGLGFGQPSVDIPDVCGVVAEDRSVRLFEFLISQGVPPGLYCFCIFDVGNIFPGETVDYTVKVLHP